MARQARALSVDRLDGSYPLGGLPWIAIARQSGPSGRRPFRSRRPALPRVPRRARANAPCTGSRALYIAVGAGVPILCTFLDYRRKIGGVGKPIRLCGDVRIDMQLSANSTKTRPPLSGSRYAHSPARGRRRAASSCRRPALTRNAGTISLPNRDGRVLPRPTSGRQQ